MGRIIDLTDENISAEDLAEVRVMMIAAEQYECVAETIAENVASTARVTEDVAAMTEDVLAGAVAGVRVHVDALYPALCEVTGRGAANLIARAVAAWGMGTRGMDDVTPGIVLLSARQDARRTADYWATATPDMDDITRTARVIARERHNV